MSYQPPFDEHSINSKAQEAINALFSIIESPNLEKNYHILKNYYKSIGMLHESESIKELIESRFNANNLHII